MPTTAVEKKPKAPKTAVEKKPKAPKTAVKKKPMVPKTANHPSYFEMIKEALLALKEKSGSSPYAIAKYMEEKHKAVLPANFRKILALQLKNSTAKGKLLKIKASFKLSEAGKKDVAPKKPVAKANATNKVVVKAKSEKAKPKAAKKKAAKPAVATPVKAGKKRSAPIAKPKVPKSIKSPAAKRARRATAKA